MLRNFTLITLLFTVACDQPNESEPLTGEAGDAGDAALDSIAELAAQERWDGGLEEYLDLTTCSQSSCPWVWTGALDGLAEELPQIPEASGGDGQGATTLTAAQDPAAAGAKTVTVTQVHCFETQDIGPDEPYLLMNGDKVWSATSVKNGSSYSIDQSDTTKVLIELWEQDVSINDKIGSFTVLSTKLNGNYSTTLTGSGGSYKVYYRVSNS